MHYGIVYFFASCLGSFAGSVRVLPAVPCACSPLGRYRYKIGNKQNRYTRSRINDTINWIRKIWKWGMGRGMVILWQSCGYNP